MAKNTTKKITSIGGSALIEGIMMRGPKRTTVCVRTAPDKIYSEDISINTIPSKCKLFKLPFLRGIAGLIDSMRLSYKALMLSADKAIESSESEPVEMCSMFICLFSPRRITAPLPNCFSICVSAVSSALFLSTAILYTSVLRKGS